MKIRVWCSGVKYSWCRKPIQAADGSWYVAFHRLERKDPFHRNYWWKWECQDNHKGHHLKIINPMRGGSRYGYEMCMQHLRNHMEKYHEMADRR